MGARISVCYIVTDLGSPALWPTRPLQSGRQPGNTVIAYHISYLWYIYIAIVVGYAIVSRFHIALYCTMLHVHVIFSINFYIRHMYNSIQSQSTMLQSALEQTLVTSAIYVLLASMKLLFCCGLVAQRHAGDDGWGDFGLDDVRQTTPQQTAPQPEASWQKVCWVLTAIVNAGECILRHAFVPVVW